MNMWIKINIWINRAVAFILYFVAICIAEKLNLRPALTFTFAAAWLFGTEFILAIIEYLTE